MCYRRITYYCCVFIAFFLAVIAFKTSCYAYTKVALPLKTNQDNTVSASKFGVKADYQNGSGTDNRVALQQAIDYCAKHNKKLLLPKGKILLNSYAKNNAAIAHGNILMLRSRLEIIGNGSVLIIGKFFDNRHFIVFSALNNISPEESDSLSSITFDAVTIDFNAGQSKMRTGYLLRKGIEFGHTVNIKVRNCLFTNGDITCAIATGFANKNISRGVEITYNRFINLINSNKNKDHSSIYINSIGSKVSYNYFSNTAIWGKLVACATEFHNSDGLFFKNVVRGYTRVLFLATALSENLHISKLTITKNEAYITNAAIYLWLEQGTSINDILIADNTITNDHIPGYSMLYNGTQGLIADARTDENSTVKNMALMNNKTIIKRTEIKGRAVNYATKFNFKNTNNICTGCKDGLFYK